MRARRARRPRSPASSASCSAPSSRARSACAWATRVVVITPQGTVTPAGTLPRAQELHGGRHLRGRHVRVRQRPRADPPRRRAASSTGSDGVSGVRLKLDDLFAAPRGGARARARRCRVDAEVRDWTRSHANFFRAVQIEKRVMFIILTLIVAVAAFNIVSAQVMVVTDKQADIAILRTLGAAPSSIMAIFMIQGALIGIIGTLIGVVGGVAARAQHRHRRAGDRAPVQRPVPRQDRLLHQRPAVGPAARRRASRSRRSRWCWRSSRRSTRAGAPRASIRRRRCAMSDAAATRRCSPAAACARPTRSGPLDVPVLLGVDLDVAPRRARGDRRRVGLGQEHAAAPAGRPRRADRGRGERRGRGVRDAVAKPSAARCATARSASSTSSITCCRSSPRWRTSRCRC